MEPFICNPTKRKISLVSCVTSLETDAHLALPASLSIYKLPFPHCALSSVALCFLGTGWRRGRAPGRGRGTPRANSVSSGVVPEPAQTLPGLALGAFPSAFRFVFSWSRRVRTDEEDGRSRAADR